TYVPWLVFGLVSGAIADRVRRRQLMIAADCIRAVTVLVLALLAGHELTGLWPLYALVFVLGSAQTLFDSAVLAFIPEHVQDDRLERANGLLFAGQAVGMTFVGPPLGALLFTWSPAAPFAVDAASFVASAALLFGVRGTEPASHTAPASGADP